VAAPEQFETYDEDGMPLGLVPRSEVHRLGLWHRAVNVLLFDRAGRLYVQRRAAGKDVWPNAWDISVGEHLQPGETFEAAAHRGLAEELSVYGVALTPLGEMFRAQVEIPEMNVHDREMQQTFRGDYDGPISPDAAEVADVRLIALADLALEITARPNDFTPWLRSRLHAFGLI
jgi:isopentenyl-diphosphate delta-isomerase